MNIDLLNKEQLEGVTTTEGPVLILAGAGSGKTRVLTYRTAYLIEECGVKPYNIMAITFTNKAAQEMKERINGLLNADAGMVWVSTFHSACVRIIRRFADRLGYGSNFTIYDSDDQKRLMKQVMNDMQLDRKRWNEKTFLNQISSAKDELITAEEYLNRFSGDFPSQMTGRVYMEYQSRLIAGNSMDFDDLIMKTVELFRQCPDVLQYYQEKYKYVMVDEYQDTNTAQFELIRLLSGGSRNLCVVGDDDQSIYKFRGANIYNILNFEKFFPDAKVIKLEENYRSTEVILDAANSVIKNNKGRKIKKLWTEHKGGEKIGIYGLDDAYQEAEFITNDIIKQGRPYSNSAVLYRTNAQSRAIEECLLKKNIPYKIIGGINFYSRLEIKDILAYLRVILNPADEISLRRVINVPKRGIGDASLTKIAAFAKANGLTFYEALEKADIIPSLGRAAASKIRSFTDLIKELGEESGGEVAPLIRDVFEKTGYADALRAEKTDEAESRLENLEELFAKGSNYDENAEEPGLAGFMEEVSLVASIDSLDESDDYVVLMTLHSAKGLEFNNVYMAGMEDGLFPGYMTIMSNDAEEMEEERRLCYVGITRAKKRLTLTYARRRMIRGEMQYGSVSRFIKEIPEDLWRKGSQTPYEMGLVRKKQSQAVYAKAVNTNYLSSQGFGTKTVKKLPAYKEGDRVRHRKFGDGTVSLIKEGNKDYEVTVDFDNYGVKKMFASFAKLEII